jgi:hypothetical protein
MCLSTVYETKPPATGTFWKVFVAYNDGTLHSEVVESYRDRKRGVWLKCHRHITSLYLSGFHGFTTRKEAIKWAGGVFPYNRIIKCKYRGGRVMGSQGELNVIVADEILIPLEGK